MESGYTEVTSISDLPNGVLKKVKIQNREILLSNFEGTISAIDNTCPHLGGDLSLGTLEGTILTCPRHKAKFDVTTGRCVAPPQVSPYSPKLPNLKSYPVKIENQKILIKIG